MYQGQLRKGEIFWGRIGDAEPPNKNRGLRAWWRGGRLDDLSHNLHLSMLCEAGSRHKTLSINDLRKSPFVIWLLRWKNRPNLNSRSCFRIVQDRSLPLSAVLTLGRVSRAASDVASSLYLNGATIPPLARCVDLDRDHGARLGVEAHDAPC
jgi:hypothetical protein